MAADQSAMRVFVFCYDPKGAPAVFVADVEPDEGGEYLEASRDLAERSGYEGPYIVADDVEIVDILSAIQGGME